ncbi:MAG: TerB family tellurite resistance protein [Pseudomonadales bacterium]
MMIKTLTTWFNSEVEGNPKDATGHPLELATAALMMEVARADFDRSSEEIDLILQQLSERLHLSDAEISNLVALAEETSEEAHDLYSFTRILSDAFTYVEKKKLVVDLWEIALADTNIDPQEDHVIRRIAGLLSVDHSDLMHARSQAKAKTDLS